ncbi:MAG: MFS transporter [Gammaproteobacteria bacterium]|nr:MFS transporter [Gammaproteobacteria bacterium]MYD75559.1 MFS transporter [Gammaproteobacteria bacterium]MYJ51154.1 MFS transporter [Gammaproteobacteria bacterium]
MLKVVGSVWALLLGFGLMMLGNGLQGTLLGVRATMESFSVAVTGVVMSGYSVGMVLGSILAPRLIRRVGHIRGFAVLASLASISILAHGLYVDAGVWTAMRILTGICYAGLYVVTESWLNDRSDNETRGQVLSVYMLVCTLGLGAGQFLLNYRDPLQLDLFIIASVIISVGVIPVLLTARPAPSFESAGVMSLKELYRASPLAVVNNGLVGVAHGAIFGFGAVYAASVLPDIGQVPLFLASFLVGSLILQWPIGWLADRVDRRLVIGATAGISLVACVLLLMTPKGGTMYFLIIALLGGAAMPLYSLVIAHANDRLEPDQIVSASGSLVLVAGMGLSAGPVLVGFLMEHFGNGAYFAFIACVFAVVVGFTAWRMMVSEAVRPQDQSPVVEPGIIGTPVAEFNAPEADEYVEALMQDELERLDESQA